MRRRVRSPCQRGHVAVNARAFQGRQHVRPGDLAGVRLIAVHVVLLKGLAHGPSFQSPRLIGHGLRSDNIFLRNISVVGCVGAVQRRMEQRLQQRSVAAAARRAGGVAAARECSRAVAADDAQELLGDALLGLRRRAVALQRRHPAEPAREVVVESDVSSELKPLRIFVSPPRAAPPRPRAVGDVASRAPESAQSAAESQSRAVAEARQRRAPGFDGRLVIERAPQCHDGQAHDIRDLGHGRLARAVHGRLAPSLSAM
mmetsp:Transcript_29831/g.103100  ORF Transcript_29831/g.103100 Transcript_29831/m.103100 type:complete len:258 (-) Transcript_29831:5-778(-)